MAWKCSTYQSLENMITEKLLKLTRTCLKQHAKNANDNRFIDSRIHRTWQKQNQVAKIRARKLHAT